MSRLVLDSVVPSWNVDPLQLVNMRQSAAVLRDVCAAQRCGFDPASDLAAVVRRYHDGPALLDMLVALSVGDPSFPGVPAALHAAAAGHPDALTALVARVRAADAATAGELSQGLHASALCADMPMPWGGPDTPLAAGPPRWPGRSPGSLRLRSGRSTGPPRQATASSRPACTGRPPPPRPGPLPRNTARRTAPDPRPAAGRRPRPVDSAGGRTRSGRAGAGRPPVRGADGGPLGAEPGGLHPGGGRTRQVPRLSSHRPGPARPGSDALLGRGVGVPPKYRSRTWRKPVPRERHRDTSSCSPSPSSTMCHPSSSCTPRPSGPHRKIRSAPE